MRSFMVYGDALVLLQIHITTNKSESEYFVMSSSESPAIAQVSAQESEPASDAACVDVSLVIAAPAPTSSGTESTSNKTPPHTPARQRSPSFHPAVPNPFPQAAPGASAAVGHTVENSIPLSVFPIQADKLCLCFCGKPARGKTQISRRVARYLSFFHAMPVQIFSVGEYRRRKGIFALRDVDNPNEKAARDAFNAEALADMEDYMKGPAPRCVIYDAVNHNHERRGIVYEKMRASGVKVLFIEVINDDPEFLRRQFEDVALTSPDYKGVDKDEAIKDYERRVDNYCRRYESLDSKHAVESRWSFFQCDHPNSHFVIHNATGYFFTKVIHFIMNMSLGQHSFFLSRHGESEYNEEGRIGGNSSLSPYGLQYAKVLPKFVAEKITKDPVTGDKVPARLWTSTMRRTMETVQFIPSEIIPVRDAKDPTNLIQWHQMRPRAWCNLDELYAGSCDGMTYEEIEEQFPEEFERRRTDKLAYRYPRGESYLDVIARLEPMIMEMERHREPLLIISHQGILRIIHAFYTGLKREDAPYVSIPLNTVVQLTPTVYGCVEQRYKLLGESDLQDGQNEPIARSGHSTATDGSRRKIAHNDDPPSH